MKTLKKYTLVGAGVALGWTLTSVAFQLLNVGIIILIRSLNGY